MCHCAGKNLWFYQVREKNRRLWCSHSMAGKNSVLVPVRMTVPLPSPQWLKEPMEILYLQSPASAGRWLPKCPSPLSWSGEFCTGTANEQPPSFQAVLHHIGRWPTCAMFRWTASFQPHDWRRTSRQVERSTCLVNSFTVPGCNNYKCTSLGLLLHVLFLLLETTEFYPVATLQEKKKGF